MATKKVKKQAVESIKGLVIIRGKSADSESKLVGLSIKAADEQDIDMEVSVSEGNDEVLVDKTYMATINKGKSTEALNFKVASLQETDFSKYDERMVIKGDINGHLNLNIRREQEEFFYEGEEYNIAFEEVEVED